MRITGVVPTPNEIARTMSALSDLLTVCDNADVTHCLGVYRTPVDEIPPDEWPYTAVGRLMHQAKYQGIISSAEKLGRRMVGVVALHPAYRAATTVVSMPSSGNHLDAPALWKAELARVFGLQQASLMRIRDVIPQKEIQDRAERGRNQRDSMACHHVTDQSVIILDDLYMDGETMDEAVRAVRVAGASTVLGLCAVKTARGTQGGMTPSLWQTGEDHG